MNKASIPNFSFQFSVEVTQINVPGWVGGVGGVGGLTMIILPVSVQVELHWNLPTRTELGNIKFEIRQENTYYHVCT